MTLIRWLLFALMVVFGVQNTQQAPLVVAPNWVLQAPAVVWFAGFFVLGIVVGAMAFLSTVWRLRRDIKSLSQRTGQDPLDL